MTLWFYFLWSLAVFHVTFSPLPKVLTKLLWLIVIVGGIWLTVGAFIYQKNYAAFIARRAILDKEKQALMKKQAALETLYQEHPTARDVLLHLTALAAQFGEREKMLEYAKQLRDTDPNNPSVRRLLQSLQ